MTSDELADYLVDHFNDLSDPIVAFQAIKPETVAEAQKERADYGVYVLPYEESETPLDRGDTCNEQRVVSVVVNGPLKTVTRSTAMQFCEQLRRALRETTFNGYRWSGNETVSIFDANALKEKDQFLSLFRATYFTIA